MQVNKRIDTNRPELNRPKIEGSHHFLWFSLLQRTKRKETQSQLRTNKMKNDCLNDVLRDGERKEKRLQVLRECMRWLGFLVFVGVVFSTLVIVACLFHSENDIFILFYFLCASKPEKERERCGFLHLTWSLMPHIPKDRAAHSFSIARASDRMCIYTRVPCLFSRSFSILFTFLLIIHSFSSS